ncbi:MAG: exodeoxyribonuclease VII large subunit [Planctomycetota bacterium]
MPPPAGERRVPPLSPGRATVPRVRPSQRPPLSASPARGAGPALGPAPGAPLGSRSAPRQRPFTVGEVLSQLRECLEDNFLPLAVKGEVVDTRRPRSGHLYFTLRDRSARLRVVVFAQTLATLRHPVRDGGELVVWGRLSAYAGSGDVQLLADGLEPAGLGERHAERERLKRALAAEGLLDPARRRLLPVFPRRIGLVTSPTGSAIHDVLTTLSRRYPAAEVLVAPAQVNGSAAGPSVAAALRALDRRGGCCVLLLVRGGGSREDLCAFDEEPIVRAVAGCRTPVVVGVGHEDDTTLADLVADRRAPTPTGAAELVAPDARELLAELRAREGRLRRALEGRVGQARRRLLTLERAYGLRVPALALERRRRQVKDAARRLELAHPAARLRARREALERAEERLVRAAAELLARRRRALEHQAPRLRAADPGPAVLARRRALDALEARLLRSGERALEDAGQRLASAAARLQDLSPLQVLARGYSLTRDAEGGVVRDAAALQPGDEVETRLARGAFRARVLEVDAPPPSS